MDDVPLQAIDPDAIHVLESKFIAIEYVPCRLNNFFMVAPSLVATRLIS